MICEICSNTKYKNLYTIKDIKHQTTDKQFLVKKCTNCGAFIITENEKLVNAFLYYPDEYSAFQDIISERMDNDRIYPLNVLKGRLAWTKLVNISQKTKILDVGCGNGSNMAFIKKKFNPEIYGIEPSKKAVNEGQKNGLNIYNGTLNDYKTNQKFDIIYLLHVIEHLDNPKETLTKIMHLLKPNGKLVIGTPNTNSLERFLFRKYWDGWDTPRHIYMFQPKTIKYLLNCVGFKDIKIYFEIYSLYSRSFNNIFKDHNLNRPPKILRGMNMIINKFLQNTLPFIKFSGAMQIIATKNEII